MKRHLTLWFSDLHTPKHDPKAWGCFLDAVETLKPDSLWDGGDHVDLASLTRHEKTPGDVGLTMAKEFRAGKDRLAEVKGAAGKACGEFLFFEGNHEYRLDRYIASGACPREVADAIPQNTDEGLALTDTGWTYIDRERQEPFMVGDLGVHHGHFYPQHHAHKHLVSIGCNQLYGHSHRPQQSTIRRIGSNGKSEAITATGAGCLRLLTAEWHHLKAAAFHGWAHGFVAISWDGDHASCANVLIENGRAAYGGITFRAR